MMIAYDHHIELPPSQDLQGFKAYLGDTRGGQTKGLTVPFKDITCVSKGQGTPGEALTTIRAFQVP